MPPSPAPPRRPPLPEQHRTFPPYRSSQHQVAEYWTVVLPAPRPFGPPVVVPRPPARPAGRLAEVACSAAAALVALLTTGLGLLGSADGQVLWLTRSAWSAVGTVAVLALLAGLFADPPAVLWRIQLGACVGLTAVWLVLAVPVLASDIGCALTIGVVAAVASAWTSPHRPAHSRQPVRLARPAAR